jgi:hypothetical protein
MAVEFLPIMQNGPLRYNVMLNYYDNNIEKYRSLSQTDGLGTFYSENKDVSMCISIEGKLLQVDQGIQTSQNMMDRYSFVNTLFKNMLSIMERANHLTTDMLNTVTQQYTIESGKQAVDTLLQELTNIVNQKFQEEYIFGFGNAKDQPIKNLSEMGSINDTQTLVSDKYLVNPQVNRAKVDIPIGEFMSIPRNPVLADDQGIEILVRSLLNIKGLLESGNKDIVQKDKLIALNVQTEEKLIQSKANLTVFQQQAQENKKNLEYKKIYLLTTYDHQCREDITAIQTNLIQNQNLRSSVLNDVINSIKTSKETRSILDKA